MGIILELGSQGNLGLYYLDHICDLFTYSKSEEARCKKTEQLDIHIFGYSALIIRGVFVLSEVLSIGKKRHT